MAGKKKQHDSAFLSYVRRQQAASISRKSPQAAKVVPRPIFNKDKHAHLIRSVMDLMAAWRLSPFEYEGAARSGLRSALCLAGYGWRRSDDEAAFIVSEVLKGKQRPTWLQGQPEYVIPREDCQKCGNPIDAEDMAAGRRYCSEFCSKSAKTYREEHFNHSSKLANNLAAYYVAKDQSEPRNCVHCRTPFKSVFGARHCSKACVGATRPNNFQVKNCEVCRTDFVHTTHKNRPGRFCSTACMKIGIPASLPVRQCAECSTEFQPKHPKGKFCCHRCAVKNSERRLKALAGPKILDRPCENCGKTFIPGKSITRFCGRPCQKQALRRAKKASSETPIHKLFDEAA